MKNVNRAKFILSQTLGLDENGAHKYLEKQAMDRRMSKAAVAKEILDDYNG
jgi:response regulator NasT